MADKVLQSASPAVHREALAAEETRLGYIEFMLLDSRMLGEAPDYRDIVSSEIADCLARIRWHKNALDAMVGTDYWLYYERTL